MRFYWKDKGDQLLVRRGNLPEGHSNNDTWTYFEMGLREATPMPVAFDFIRFLTSSIIFMVHLSEVTVYFNGHRLVKLVKSPGSPTDLRLPTGLQNKHGSMTIQGINIIPLHVKADVMRWVYTSGSEKPQRLAALLQPIQKSTGFFSSIFSALSTPATPQRTPTPLPPVPAPSEDETNLKTDETNLSLSIFSATVAVKVDKKRAAELLRATKKNPPSTLKYQLIYTGKDDYDASKKQDEEQAFSTGSIFQGLRADLEGHNSTRIFIGHSTAQTTGLGGHMASRFIPTVERESLDLMDRNVASWNKELLAVGGYLARCAYQHDIDNIRALWEGASGRGTQEMDPELRTWLQGRALHALKFFSFHPSTPSAEVSILLESSFFACGDKLRFPLMSNVGIRSIADIRIALPEFAFLKLLPVIPAEIETGAPLMMATLQSRGMIKQITFDDVLKELNERPLKTEEMIGCLKWWINLNQQGDSSRLGPHRSRLLNAAILLTVNPTTQSQSIIPLSTIHSFINRKGIGAHIPVDGPLPSYLLPEVISSNFTPSQLIDSFPWQELTVAQWLTHICDPDVRATKADHDIDVSPFWAERVLTCLVRAWPSVPDAMKIQVAETLKSHTCIPTTGGMKQPSEAYFSNANVFPDLPIVSLPSGTVVKGTMERLLQYLGVRKYVDLQIVFTRMLKSGGWNVADFIKYLVAVQSELKPDDWKRLQVTPIFAKEGDSPSKPNEKPVRYRADQLYEPSDVFRNLGLPIISWVTTAKWRSSSEDAKLLYRLGLLRFPPLQQLIELCANPSTTVNTAAFKYLIDNSATHYQNFHPKDFINVAFIPASNGKVSCLNTPRDVVSEATWAPLGFFVLPEVYRQHASKLKIERHPGTGQLVQLLKTSPPTEEQARQWFPLLATRVSDFSSTELAALSELPFIPVRTAKSLEKPGGVQWLSPSKCLLGASGEGKFLSKLFTYVDFGPAGNIFLGACGSKPEASVDEIALLLVKDPHRFYDLAGGPETFLRELRNIAVNSRLLASTTLIRMKRTPILLAVRRKVKRADGKAHDLDEDDWEFQYDLKRPEEIAIVDDNNAFQLFGDSLFTAPQEDILEDFYISLGSRRLSSLVKQDYSKSAEMIRDPEASRMQSLVLERLPLFLHGQTHARPKVSLSWLSKPGNFVARSFGKITVNWSLTYGTTRLSREQEASAIAKRESSIQLWIAKNTQLDMYEVATSLSRLLFESAKANDILLFMTILSTDLKSLKRRGYNVDRILRQQEADREAAKNAKILDANQGDTRLVSARDGNNVPPPVPPKTRPIDMKGPAGEDSSLLRPSSPPRSKGGSSLINSIRNFGQKGKDAARDINYLLSSSDSKPASPPSSPPHTQMPGALPPPSTGREIQRRTDSPHVTPLSNIDSNINMAIRACRPESTHLLRNRTEMRQVKESLNEGYCDISGGAGDLQAIGEIRSVKVYLTPEEPDRSTFMARKHDSMNRFLEIMMPLAKVYSLPLGSLHIFYDLRGDLIAFNRNASIFVNLRFFEAWHDADVQGRNTDPAFTSWYFTLAHEIAHNLVQPHNSEHEFYFSAICEKHIKGLGELLSA
ncbi:hypothetical protein HGRIS_002254 [Hohenbuehelia grisea]